MTADGLGDRCFRKVVRMGCEAHSDPGFLESENVCIQQRRWRLLREVSAVFSVRNKSVLQDMRLATVIRQTLYVYYLEIRDYISSVSCFCETARSRFVT